MDESRVLDQTNFNFMIELDLNTKLNIREDLEKIDGMEVECLRVEGVEVGMEVEGSKVD